MVLSKLWNQSLVYVGVLKRRMRNVPKILVRRSGFLIPPSQYDEPFPKRLRLIYAMRVYWEIIPLIFVTVFTFTLCGLTIIHKFRSDLDLVNPPRLGRQASLVYTMNLRCPVYYKHIILNPPQPWPEMQDILDKMKLAEKRIAKQASVCSLVRKKKKPEEEQM